MQPIDFSPNGGDMHDDFIEKTLQRSASVTSADRQRQEFVADLEHDHNSLTHGIPEHDFTAGTAAGAVTYGHYDPDPYEHDPYSRSPGAYDFSNPTGGDYDYPAAPEAAAAGYPSQHQQHLEQQQYYSQDYPTQDSGHHGHDDGYANLQRGPSVNAGDFSAPPVSSRPFDPLAGSDFAVGAGGRPTGGQHGAEGPYAQAATYRY